MASIELVIKIPEGLKKDFESEQWTALSCMEMKDALTNGTPLPKGHGRLIDADANIKGLSKMKVVDDKDKQSVRFAIIELENAPTIIDADKESK